MQTCEINNITNRSKYTLLVSKLEDIGRNSFLVPPEDAKANLIWLPWVRNADEFVKKVLVILSLEDQRVLGFLWQRGDDAIIRISKTGYEHNGRPLEGRNSGSITLTVEADGSLRGD